MDLETLAKELREAATAYIMAYPPDMDQSFEYESKWWLAVARRSIELQAERDEQIRRLCNGGSILEGLILARLKLRTT